MLGSHRVSSYFILLHYIYIYFILYHFIYILYIVYIYTSIYTYVCIPLNVYIHTYVIYTILSYFSCTDKNLGHKLLNLSLHRCKLNYPRLKPNIYVSQSKVCSTF